MKLLFFDIDGTLLGNTGGVGARGFNRAFFELFGVKEAWGNTNPHGKTDPMLIREVYKRALNKLPTEEEIKRLINIYISCFEEELSESKQPFALPGVSELLETLSNNKQIKLGIQTGNLEQTAKLKLKHAQLDHFFSFGGYASDSEIRAELIKTGFQRVAELNPKINFTNENTFVIGDAPQDIEAGKSLDFKTIAVATGRSEKTTLENLSPDLALENFINPEPFYRFIGHL